LSNVRLNELVRQLDARKAFLAKVDRRGAEECWEWMGNSRGGDQVGVFYCASRRWNARRVMWVFQHGLPPRGRFVGVTCGNVRCLNPAHLVLQETTHAHRRKFDHDAARARLAAGVALADVAAELGVTVAAVERLTWTEERLQRARRTHLAWQIRARQVPCAGGCGGLAWKRRTRDKEAWCQRCAGLRQATTVREDTLLCTTCGEWKPDSEFSKCTGNRARRGRHGQCRACNREVKRKHRAARKVPCVKCGRPRSHPLDRGARGDETDTGLCASCYRESRGERGKAAA
jgi:hypothetical protein